MCKDILRTRGRLFRKDALEHHHSVPSRESLEIERMKVEAGAVIESSTDYGNVSMRQRIGYVWCARFEIVIQRKHEFTRVGEAIGEEVTKRGRSFQKTG